MTESHNMIETSVRALWAVYVERPPSDEAMSFGDWTDRMANSLGMVESTDGITLQQWTDAGLAVMGGHTIDAGAAAEETRWEKENRRHQALELAIKMFGPDRPYPSTHILALAQEFEAYLAGVS